MDEVIAIAPAAHGVGGQGHLAAVHDRRRLLATLPSPGPRVAAALLNGNDFDADPDRRAGGRAGGRAELLAQAGNRGDFPFLAIRPPAPILGHGGGARWEFTRDYAGCPVAFMTGPAPGSGVRVQPCPPAGVSRPPPP